MAMTKLPQVPAKKRVALCYKKQGVIRTFHVVTITL